MEQVSGFDSRSFGELTREELRLEDLDSGELYKEKASLPSREELPYCAKCEERGTAKARSLQEEDSMTRFKELRRINAAIEHGSRTELQWALEYCKMRIGIAGQFSRAAAQEKHWRKVLRDVEEALSKCS